MRLSPSTLAVLSAGLVALAGCGGGSDEAAETVSTTAPPATTGTAPAVVTSTQAVPSQTVVVPPTTTATTTATTTTGTSGGTAPPTATTTTEAAPTTAGDQPQITLRGDGTARATAADDGQAEIWCDAARQGSYDSQLGTATTLVIAIDGSDQVTRCALER